MVDHGFCKNNLMPEQDSNKAQIQGSHNTIRAMLACAATSKDGVDGPKRHHPAIVWAVTPCSNTKSQ